ncbi:MAG: succinate dehydrogenase cytochrome b subunit [Thermoanaerobaculia bacterium]
MAESRSVLSSSLGKKAVMAVSGLILVGFVLAHMAGNLKMYLGREAFNHYAAGLRELGQPFFPHGGLLWVARGVLLAAVVAHIGSAWLLTRQAQRARATRYQRHAYAQADYAVRTMRWGGVILLLFVVYHLLHLTLGVVHPSFTHPETLPGGTEAYHAYENLVAGFAGHPLVALAYMAANLALGFHLYHGIWSAGRSLGLGTASSDALWRRAALLVAFVVTAGNLSFPIAVLCGVVK